MVFLIIFSAFDTEFRLDSSAESASIQPYTAEETWFTNKRKTKKAYDLFWMIMTCESQKKIGNSELLLGQLQTL